MKRWFVSIAGFACDLKAAASCFDLPEISFFVDSDFKDCIRSSDFDLLTTPVDVETKSLEILRVVNGAIRVMQETYRPIHPWSVHEDGRVGYYNCPSRDNWHLQNAVDQRPTSDPQFQIVAPKPEVIRLFHAARKHSEVKRALDFWAADRHGTNVYKIYEIIRNDIGTRRLEQMEGNSQIKRFTGSINRPEVLGDYARHAILPGDPPTDTMTRDGVEQFIRQLLQKWAFQKS